ncbi:MULTISPECIES: hypothetical protein [unclassified Roseitalea]|nr:MULTISPECIES: hypothetical protein [unclassified Roseitalea]
MRVTVPLLFGRLKIKTKPDLRRSEYYREVPVMQVGRLYFIFRPGRARGRRRR